MYKHCKTGVEYQYYPNSVWWPVCAICNLTAVRNSPLCSFLTISVISSPRVQIFPQHFVLKHYQSRSLSILEEKICLKVYYNKKVLSYFSTASFKQCLGEEWVLSTNSIHIHIYTHRCLCACVCTINVCYFYASYSQHALCSVLGCYKQSPYSQLRNKNLIPNTVIW